MRFLPRVVVVLATAATAALAAPMERRAQFPDPNDDPFYNTPSNIGTYTNGQVIQSRKADTGIAKSNNVDSFQLSYRTTNTQGEAVANVATVWIPTKPASPPKILSIQIFEDSTQLDCAPSYSYLSGWMEPNSATAIVDAPIFAGWALKQGYYVVSSDHEGPRSAFIAGYEEGMAILDGIRALQNYKELAHDSAVGMYGYSGGAHATAWAVNLAESYAPELNMIGAAYGGTPVSAKDTFLFINKGFVAGFALAGISGLAAAHPDMEDFLLPRLNEKGVDAFHKIRSRGFCIANVVTGFPFVDVYSYVNETDLLDKEPIAGILKKETLLQSDASYTVPVPKFPRFMYHAVPDEIVPYAPAAAYVREQCAKGADILFSPYPIAEHISAQVIGMAPSINWLSQAFEGKAPKVICGGSTPIIAGVNSPPAKDVLGDDLANQLNNLKGDQNPMAKLIDSAKSASS